MRITKALRRVPYGCGIGGVINTIPLEMRSLDKGWLNGARLRETDTLIKSTGCAIAFLGI